MSAELITNLDNLNHTGRIGLASFIRSFNAAHGEVLTGVALAEIGNGIKYINSAPLNDEERNALRILQRAIVEGTRAIIHDSDSSDAVKAEALAILDDAEAKIY